MKNYDKETVSSFGDEWNRFTQEEVDLIESKKLFELYFSIFPWNELPRNAEGFDMGCGSGRWARFVAPQVFKLNCIEPSSALQIAQKNLIQFSNIKFHKRYLEDSGLLPNSQDFGYCLGVVHHAPDTQAAIKSCVDLLKPGAPILLYLYYAFDNRPSWFRFLWKLSNLLRRVVAKLPNNLKCSVTDLIALFVYFPLARTSLILKKFGFSVRNFPLNFYSELSFYNMRTDARDRFGTPLEKRFSRQQITVMMKNAGLTKIKFSESSPFWCAVGFKSTNNSPQ